VGRHHHALAAPAVPYDLVHRLRPLPENEKAMVSFTHGL